MDFSPDGERNRNVTGLSLVVVAHLILGYALVNGLAQRVAKVFKQPLEVSLVDEIKPPPPPPPLLKPVTPPPRALPPPPVYVPPPEVQVRTPAVETVTAVTTTPPPVSEPVPAPIAPAPVAKAIVEAPPAPVAAPAVPVVALGAACPNHIAVRSKVEYPAQAQLRSLSGDVLIEFTVAANGDVGGVHVVRSSNPVFEDVAIKAASQHLHCVGQGQDVHVRIPFVFRYGQ